MKLEAKDILKKYWGFDEFRNPQDLIIQNILQKKHTLALLPTGGGKSICFQVPTMMMKGCCVVISPLIALMKDQVNNLKKREISAALIDSGMSYRQVNITIENAQNGAYKFLYISPERLQSSSFVEKLVHVNICLFAIDEAHCISQWGYDFRPSYLKIADIREKVGYDIPFVALTASATPEVQEDIIQNLKLENCEKFSISFERKNLSYSCIEIENKNEKLLHILSKIQGSAIVYARNRALTVEISKFLQANKVSADFYHAGLHYLQREQKQLAWTENRIRVIVATNAFGMGIDKPNVRAVVHFDIPENLESYYQEAGRAGRDGEKSFATILYHNHDLDDLESRMESEFPTLDELAVTYQKLTNFYQLAVGEISDNFDFDIEQFCRIYELKILQTYKVLKQLEFLGFIQFNEAFYAPPSLFVPNQTNLYTFQIENSKFDIIIKSILRLYGGGVFSNYMAISEKKIAQLSNTEEENIKKFLKYLDGINLAVYVPQIDKPQINFLGYRHDVKEIFAQKLIYNAKMMKAKTKFEAIRNYVLGKECRTKSILNYFGEQHYSECGNCDICLEKKRKPLDYYYEEYKNQILKALEKGEISVNDFTAKITSFQKDVFLHTIQKMLDENLIIYASQGHIKIKNLEI